MARARVRATALSEKRIVRRVILESPYAGDVEANLTYARACMRDSLARGEAPIASHLLYTQEGILDDNDPDQRALGIAAGLRWLSCAKHMVLYTDRGISPGMAEAAIQATNRNVKVEYRRIYAGDE